MKKTSISEELVTARQRLLVEEKRRKTAENDLAKLKKTVPETDNDFEVTCYSSMHFGVCVPKTFFCCVSWYLKILYLMCSG